MEDPCGVRRPISQVGESIAGPRHSEMRRCGLLNLLDRRAVEERGDRCHTANVDASPAIPLGRRFPIWIDRNNLSRKGRGAYSRQDKGAGHLMGFPGIEGVQDVLPDHRIEGQREVL